MTANELVNEDKMNCIIFSEAENDCRLNDLIDVIKARLSVTDVTLLGNMSVESTVRTVAGYLIQLLRKHGIHKNEREMVLSHDDTFVILQLCLAEENKKHTGYFDIEVSKVLEMHNCLVKDKLSSKVKEDKQQNTDYLNLRDRYEDYLQQNNILDCMDVLSRLKAELLVNEVLKNEIEKSNFLILNPTSNKIEQAMIEWISESKTACTALLETSLNDSHFEHSSYSLEPLNNVLDRLDSISNSSINTPGNKGCRSLTESYAEKVMMSYLHLLVNTRSELAVSHVLNIPERELDQNAFTAVKREAKAKKMSIYQAAVSHVMRVRLGGRSYAPNSQSPLNPYIKGLAEFTDLIHKLSNIIEEETNIRNAVKKVLNILKQTIIRSKDTHLRRESIETVTSKLQQLTENTISDSEQTSEKSPVRDAYHGGSLIGRRTLRIIRCIVDTFSSKLPGITFHMDLLTDMYSSQTTPVRFPSILSKFRSPIEASPGSKESLPLAERIKMNRGNKPKGLQIPRFQSSMNWAMPAHDIHLKNDIALKDNFKFSKAVKHGEAKTLADDVMSHTVMESINDQENIGEANLKMQSTKPATIITKRLNSCSKTDQPAKKMKKSAPVKTAKKKSVPLAKGQKQLTAFFRL